MTGIVPPAGLFRKARKLLIEQIDFAITEDAAERTFHDLGTNLIDPILIRKSQNRKRKQWPTSLPGSNTTRPG